MQCGQSMQQCRATGTALLRQQPCPRLQVLAQASPSAPATKARTTKGTTQKQQDARTTTKLAKAPTPQTQRKGNSEPQSERPKGSQFYFNFTGFPFPIGPVFQRRTVRREVEKDTIWVFEQTQAIELFSVYTPVRMTVVRLKSGGLWVHAPVAPTDECLRLLRELGSPVEYIVLPTFAYEHKVFVGPFSRKFPKAKVYVAPYQWSYPLNLPPQFFGIFPAGELVTGDDSVPWADEIDQKLFLPPSVGIGSFVRFSEVAFFHKRSRTLLVTDAVVYVPLDPPECIPKQAVLESAKDGWLARFVAGGRSAQEIEAIAEKGPVEDTQENRRKGWQRMSLLVLYFGPGNLLTPQESFDAISGRLFVGPVVETLVYSKVPKAVTEWVDEVCADWNFRQIIPCHFDAPIKATPADFKRAFTFAYEQVAETEGTAAAAAPPAPAPSGPAGLLSSLLGRLGLPAPGGGAAAGAPLGRPVVFPIEDMKTLNGLNNTLLNLGAVKRNADEPGAAADA